MFLKEKKKKFRSAFFFFNLICAISVETCLLETALFKVLIFMKFLRKISRISTINFWDFRSNKSTEFPGIILTFNFNSVGFAFFDSLFVPRWDLYNYHSGRKALKELNLIRLKLYKVSVIKNENVL